MPLCTRSALDSPSSTNYWHPFLEFFPWATGCRYAGALDCLVVLTTWSFLARGASNTIFKALWQPSRGRPLAGQGDEEFVKKTSELVPEDPGYETAIKDGRRAAARARGAHAGAVGAERAFSGRPAREEGGKFATCPPLHERASISGTRFAHQGGLCGRYHRLKETRSSSRSLSLHGHADSGRGEQAKA